MGKMFKYDMKSIWRPLFPFTLGLFGITLLGCIFCRYLQTFPETDRDLPFTKILVGISGVYMAVFVVSFVAFGLISIIFVLKRYYENFFTDEGYLTFTLPVKTSSLLMSKLVSGSLSLLICETIAGICMIIFFLIGFSREGLIDPEAIDNIKSIFTVVFSTEYILIFAEIGLIALLVTVFQTAFFHLCITIGSIIAKKHKILASVGIYYGANFVLSSAANIVAMIFLFNADYFDSMDDLSPMIHSTLLIICLLIAAAVIGTYFFNRYLLTKKFNLN